jgi:hypothetical protein
MNLEKLIFGHWALFLYAISLGRLPFKGKNESDILNKICKGKLIYP